MQRRSFIKNSMATGVLLTINACNNPKNANVVAGDREFPLSEMSISELTDAYTSGSLNCESVTRLYLERINAIDKSGPGLHSIIMVNPEAMAQAKHLDGLRKAGNIKGPLHGVPILLKDNIDTTGGMNTTAGSLALKDNAPEKNAFIVQKLIDAGALILGKTNLSEWANFRSTRSSSGWSAVGGQTRNPYILDRSPCGSSSGSGAAVAANLCAAAIGTETDGSIVCPSSINGIVGIKPTIGLVSRSGIVPIAHSHDTAGPMARSVSDAALLLTVLAGADPADTATMSGPANNPLDYSQYLTIDGLKGKRIGIARQFFGFHEQVDTIMAQAIADMARLGAVMVEVPEDVLADMAEEDAYTVLLYEFKHDLEAYLKKCPASVTVKTLDELIAFNEAHKGAEMPYFGQEIFIEAVKKGPLSDQAYLDALDRVRKACGENGIDKALKTQELDAIIAPSNGPAWPIDLVGGDHFLGGSSSPAARSGYPSITVPAGNFYGLPIGISIFAGAYSEPALIGMAYAYEQATKHRRLPQFQATLQVIHTD